LNWEEDEGNERRLERRAPRYLKRVEEIGLWIGTWFHAPKCGAWVSGFILSMIRPPPPRLMFRMHIILLNTKY